MKELIIKRLMKLLAVRSVVTLAMTAGMLCILSGAWQPTDAVMALFSTSYGAIITYFFTKEKEEQKND